MPSPRRPAPTPPAAVRRGAHALTVDLSRLPGAGIPRVLTLLGRRSQRLRLLHTAWADLDSAAPVCLDAPGLVSVEAGSRHPDSALPGTALVALVDPRQATPAGLAALLDRWREADPDAYRAAELYLPDPDQPTGRARRVRAPHPGRTGTQDWLAQARAGQFDDVVQPWPGPGPVGRLVRAALAAPPWCPPGWRVVAGSAGDALLGRLAAESDLDRLWTFPARGGAPGGVAGVVLDGLTVTRGGPVWRLDADEVVGTARPQEATGADLDQSGTAGHVPPPWLLGQAGVPGGAAARTYAALRAGGLNPERAAQVAAAVLTAPG